MEEDDRATKSIDTLLENGRYLEKAFKESITNIKEQLRTLLQQVETIEHLSVSRIRLNVVKYYHNGLAFNNLLSR